MYSIHYKAFTVFIVLFYALAILAALGLHPNAAAYVASMDYYMRIYICLFLMWRFNPLSTHQVDALDKKIAFVAGVVILSTTALNRYLVVVRSTISDNILKLI